jgi:hypothetical protein
MSIYLETIISVVFVFFIFSIIGYIIHEWWAALREKRGKLLEFSIGEILNDRLNKSFNILLYEHPQIDLLRKSQNDLPSYIPASNFATALIDIIGNECITVFYRTNKEGMLEETTTEFSSDPYKRFIEGTSKLNHSGLKILLQSLLLRTTNYADLQNNIENWFNQYMDRVSGWYKKDTRKTLRVIAVIVVIFFNIDAIYLIQSIYRNDQLRNTLVAAADKLVEDQNEVNAVLGISLRTQLQSLDSSYAKSISTADSLLKNNLHEEWQAKRTQLIDSAITLRKHQYNSWIEKINSYGLPIGWNLSEAAQPENSSVKKKNKNSGWFQKVRKYFEDVQNQENIPGMPKRTLWTILLGWIIAAIAISFGAPFWFDILNRIINIRRTGIKPN